MPELPPVNRNRWFLLRRPGDLAGLDVVAERCSQAGALAQFDRPWACLHRAHRKRRDW